jgi:hypothetical protein
MYGYFPFQNVFYCKEESRMKKVLSIVLSIAMVVCLMPSMAFASADASGTGEVEGRQTFSDIEDEPCEGAVNVLNALGVVNGYPDGTFRPGENVTRAHMAQMITKALSVEAYANATTSIFSDMDSTTWAIPQVEYCAQLGIVKGYGDGRFGPNDLVTYEQAATMIVRAVGYTDDCNEMISGVWPANYVQKALELGVFSDTDNGGNKTATRGDVALMLYNGMDKPQVYIDNEGKTENRSGDEAFVGSGGNIFYGTSMLAQLNKDGSYDYDIVNFTDIDNAIYNIGDYFGAVAKIYRDKNDDVLAIGDIQTTFMTGKFNGDFDEFNVDGKKYTFSDGAVKRVSKNGNAFGTENATAAYPAPIYENGERVGNFWTVEGLEAAGKNGPMEDQKITLAVKYSGSTITQVFSAHYWYLPVGSSFSKVVEESNISPIMSSQKLFGKDFKKDYDGDPKEGTFELVGVSSLEDIAVDDVVSVYYDSQDYIRRVEVGTEEVDGVLDSFSMGTYSNKTTKWGRVASATIDGTSYNTSYLTIAEFDNAEDMENWTSEDSDDVQVGDTVKAYLDWEGAIFQIEQSSANSSNYALVTDYDITYEDGMIVNGAGLNGDNSLISLMTANGSVYTFAFKNEADVENPDGDLNKRDFKIGVGDIVTYDLNSANKIRKIYVKASSALSDSVIKSDYKVGMRTADVTKKGFWDGESISESATVFSIDKYKERDISKNSSIPAIWIDEDDAGIVPYANLTDTDDVCAYNWYKKNNKITAFVIDGDAVSSTKTFGFITGWSKLSSDHSSGCKYQVTALIDGESTTYYYDADDLLSVDKQKLFQFKFNANGYITDTFDYRAYGSEDPTDFDQDFEGKLLGYAITGMEVFDLSDGKSYNDVGITFRNGTVCDVNGNTHSIDSDTYYYEWKGGSGNVAASSRTDIESADAGKYVLFFDVPNDDSDDPDGVVDIILMCNKAVANANSKNSVIDPLVPATEIKNMNIVLLNPVGQTATGINNQDTDFEVYSTSPSGFEVTSVTVTNASGNDEVIASLDRLTYTITVNETDANHYIGAEATAGISFNGLVTGDNVTITQPVYNSLTDTITFTAVII